MNGAILILRPDHLGDLLLTTPTIRVLRRSFPGRALYVATSTRGSEVYRGNPHITRLVPLDCPWLLRGEPGSYTRLAHQVRCIRGLGVEILVNFRVAATTALVARLCGARRRWGFAAAKSAWAHTDRVPFDPTRHIVDNQLNLAEALGGTRDVEGLEYHGPAPDGWTLPAGLGWQPFVVLSPGAGYPMKLWAPDRWRALCAWMQTELGAVLALTGTAGETRLMQSIAAGLPRPAVCLTDGLTVSALAEILRRARLIVTVDSGTMHLAVAVRRPVVALFGPTDPRHWGPYPNGCPNEVVTENPDGPFYKQDCATARGMMQRITVARVQAAIERVIQAAPAGW